MLHVIAFILMFSIGCMVGEDAVMPAAPSQLTAEPGAGGGVHLTWADNSSDEMHFMVMRTEHAGHGGAVDDEPLVTLPPDTRQYHDTTAVSGTTYMYMVAAENALGESAAAETMFAAP